MIGEKRQIGVCPVTSVANLFFGYTARGIYTTKNQGMIESKSIKKNQIIKKFQMHPDAIRNVSQ